jgi:hypothetical protein
MHTRMHSALDNLYPSSMVAHLWRYMCDVTCNRFRVLGIPVERSRQIFPIVGYYDCYYAPGKDGSPMLNIVVARFCIHRVS